jgi:hypothetical protein
MAEWFVRPDTSHSGTRDGKTYGQAWGGWAAIVWGASGVKAGDTLYVCGTHSITSSIAVGNHGATEGSRVTISGAYAPDPGSITVTAIGGVFLQANRNYTTYTGLTITGNKSYCVYFYTAAPVIGVTIDGCTFNGGTASIISLDYTNTTTYTDLTITNNSFVGGSGSTMGSAISWLGASSGTPITSLNRVTISNNSFTGCTSTRAVIELLIYDGAHADTKMTDIVATGNTFIDCGAVAMEIYGKTTDGAGNSGYGLNTGIRITDNIIYNQQAVGVIGGGFAIGGFGPSTTPGFGDNIIARNSGYGLSGITGMINVFYGTYRVYDNVGEDITTSTIDGTGILFDHDTRNCQAYGNHFKRLTGMPGIYYSGNGITVLDSTGVEVYGNVVEDAYCGIHIGDAMTGQSSNIHNNTFIRCSRAVDMLSSADKTTNLVRNNIFTAAGPVTSVRVSGGGWTGESGNCFYGFSATENHSLAVNTITTDPQLDERHGCAANEVKGKGTYIGEKVDFYKRPFRNPPIIGAVEDVTKDLYRTLKGI